MIDIFEKITELRSQNKSVALVTIISTKGSTPRETGSKMLVSSDGEIYGTIGGSSVEAMMIEKAKESILTGNYFKEWHDLDDHQKDDTGMICGGKMEFFVEPIGVQPHLIIFGGGHVALPLARLSAQTGFRYTIVEDRPEFSGLDRFPDAKEIIPAKPEEIEEMVNISEADYVAIVTRSHELDYQALKVILKYPVNYLGLIASKVKKKQIFAQLREEGFDKDLVEKIYSPIGLDIAAQTPEEIAVSIVAELIAVKNGKG